MKYPTGHLDGGKEISDVVQKFVSQDILLSEFWKHSKKSIELYDVIFLERNTTLNNFSKRGTLVTVAVYSGLIQAPSSNMQPLYINEGF